MCRGRVIVGRDSMTARPESLIVRGGLDVDSRRAFVATAIDAIDRAAGRTDGPVGLDCSQIETLDEMTLGMLVVVARAAERRGARVVVHAAPRLRADLDAAGASHFFDWR